MMKFTSRSPQRKYVIPAKAEIQFCLHATDVKWGSRVRGNDVQAEGRERRCVFSSGEKKAPQVAALAV
jgi:hypothetical protein